MEHSKTYGQLVQLEPAEQVLKEYYMKNHTFYPMERIPALVSGADCSKWGLTTRNIPALTNPLDTVTAFELLEEDYFSGDCDIRILKNFCYTQVGEHQHTFFEMMYMLKGTCENKIDGRDNNIQAGDLCIIPPRVSHSIKMDSDGVLLNILVRTSTFTESFVPLLRNSNILSDFFNEILYANNYKKYLLFHTDRDELIQNYVLSMFKEQQGKEPYYTNVLHGQLMSFFGKLLQRHENHVEYPASYVEKYDVVPKIIAYIQKNGRTTSLNQCAEQFHFNPQYLSSLLKKHTGAAFSSILTEVRMMEAAEHLLKSDISIKELGILLGFKEPEYFMRVFKKYYGITPSDYRIRNKVVK